MVTSDTKLSRVDLPRALPHLHGLMDTCTGQRPVLPTLLLRPGAAPTLSHRVSHRVPHQLLWQHTTLWQGQANLPPHAIATRQRAAQSARQLSRNRWSQSCRHIREDSAGPNLYAEVVATQSWNRQMGQRSGPQISAQPGSRIEFSHSSPLGMNPPQILPCKARALYDLISPTQRSPIWILRWPLR